MNRKSAITCALCCLLASGSVLAADADVPRQLLQPPKRVVSSPITDRWAVRGTYQQPEMNTQLRYDGTPILQGTELDAEDDLGWDDRLNQGNFEMIVRMLERHRLRVDFFGINRGGSVVMNRQVRFGDDVYQVTDRVNTDSQIRFMGLTYTYSLLHADRYELAAGLGVHLFQVDGHAAVPARRLEDRFNVADPLPTLALDGTYLMSDEWSINARVQALKLNIQDIEGHFSVWHGDVQYRPWKGLAFGVGYTKTSLHIDSADSSFSGRLFLDVKGPEAFVRVSL